MNKNEHRKRNKIMWTMNVSVKLLNTISEDSKQFRKHWYLTP